MYIITCILHVSVYVHVHVHTHLHVIYMYIDLQMYILNTCTYTLTCIIASCIVYKLAYTLHVFNNLYGKACDYELIVSFPN